MHHAWFKRLAWLRDCLLGGAGVGLIILSLASLYSPSFVDLHLPSNNSKNPPFNNSLKICCL
jgi:hypothetical protein